METITITLLLSTLITSAVALITYLNNRKTASALRDAEQNIRQYIAQNASLAQIERAATQAAQIASAELAELRRQNTELIAAVSTERAGKEALVDKLKTQKQEIEQLQTQMKNEFENIANRLFDEKSDKFTRLNAQTVGQLLAPLEKNIGLFREQVEKNLTEETKQRTSLEEQVRHIVEQTNKVSAEANNLASALKGKSKIRGTWGELILESVLEQSGLVRGREFELQQSFTDENGRRLQPDALIYLPGERTIVVDSKVSLVDYDNYCATDDVDEQQQAIAAHLASIYRHIDSLSAKRYDKVVGAPDFTFMFVPIEPAYMLAIEKDGTLWNYAFTRKIMLISPSNLIPCLHLIGELWSRQRQEQNIEVIIKQAERIYKKLYDFVGSLDDVGKSIDKAKESYDQARKRLSDGKDNALGQIERFRLLGLRTDKKITENSEQ